jgi:hypothetical protein
MLIASSPDEAHKGRLHAGLLLIWQLTALFGCLGPIRLTAKPAASETESNLGVISSDDLKLAIPALRCCDVDRTLSG